MEQSTVGGAGEAEELELTPRPILPWEAEHTHQEHVGDLTLVDVGEPLFSAQSSYVSTAGRGGDGNYAYAHAPATPVCAGAGEGSTPAMRYVFIDGDGQIQEAPGAEAPGGVPAVHAPPLPQPSEERIERTVDTAELEMVARGAAAIAPDSKSGVDRPGAAAAVFSAAAKECKACRGHHTSHTCGLKGKSVQQQAGKLRPAAATASAAIKVKGETTKLKADFAKSPPKRDSSSAWSGASAPSMSASAGAKRDSPPKKAVASTAERAAPSAAGSASASKTPPKKAPASTAEMDVSFAAGSASASKTPHKRASSAERAAPSAPASISGKHGRTPEHPPKKTLKPASLVQETEAPSPTLPAPPPTPEPPSPKPLPCCTYECCPNPLHTSGGWKRVTPETRAGGQDWTMYYGRLFCNACFTQYATTGSMARKGRPQVYPTFPFPAVSRPRADMPLTPAPHHLPAREPLPRRRSDADSN
mmetsp:Transcript_17752/g.44711  ORF Transcript_17752/g.44711 Transcript_17752/m.44711 type:complete len:474 (-) Transcript_17752:275-1696(-)